MNWKCLLWIIPLCVVIGYLFGLYIGIPEHITIDYGDNMLKVTENLKEMYNQTYNKDCIEFEKQNITYDNLICFDKK